MKQTLFYLAMAIFSVACTCEDPVYLPAQTLYPKVASPALGSETTLDTNVLDIIFSQPMNVNSIQPFSNTTIELNGFETDIELFWPSPEHLQITVFTFFTDSIENKVELWMHDDVDQGDEVQSEFGLELDGNCDNIPGGLYNATFILP